MGTDGIRGSDCPGGSLWRIDVRDAKAAARLAWLVLSLAAGFALAAGLLLPAKTVLRLAALLAAPGAHSAPCLLCGMTHAWVALRAGDLAGAAKANAGSLVLFALLAANSVAAGGVVFYRTIRRGSDRCRRLKENGKTAIGRHRC
ncbi:MAG: DUF2752 domain-containing protein [Bryobacteraceae bacterium]|nr:DUF2752 domain-containing protein [Bryobacteraceae bacterium]